MNSLSLMQKKVHMIKFFNPFRINKKEIIKFSLDKVFFSHIVYIQLTLLTINIIAVELLR